MKSATKTFYFGVLSMTILGVCPGAMAQTRVDLTVDSVQVNTPRLSQNQKVEIVATIRNNGSEAVEDVYLEVDVRKNGKRVKAIKAISVLAHLPRSGSSQGIPISMGELMPGSYEAIVKVDPDHQIHETEERNNEKKVSFAIREPIA